MRIGQLHFGSDLVLLEIEHVRRLQVLSGTVHGAENLCIVFSNGLYMGVPLEVHFDLES